MNHLQYKEIGPLSQEEVAEALQRNDPDVLCRAVLAVALHDQDFERAQALCVELSRHPHFNVRGNAVLGFGHLARIHRQLDREVVQPIIVTALFDSDVFVRGQAHCAYDDTAFFLQWDYPTVSQS
jgi:hypothetical protein